MSWKRALGVIDERIESLSHAESEQLRYWRGVIDMAYADFQTNNQGDEPSLFVSLAISMDGRTEYSRYPNLLATEVREDYGL